MEGWKDLKGAVYYWRDQRETQQIFSQNNTCPGRNWKRVSSKYESISLLLFQPDRRYLLKKYSAPWNERVLLSLYDIPPLLHTRLSPPPEVWDTSDRQRIIIHSFFQAVDFIPIPEFACLQRKKLRSYFVHI
jgi:hypothetical protein